MMDPLVETYTAALSVTSEKGTASETGALDGLLASQVPEAPATESMATEPVSEPAPVEPAPVEPAIVEPAPVEPAPVEPASVEPVEPIVSPGPESTAEVASVAETDPASIEPSLPEVVEPPALTGPKRLPIYTLEPGNIVTQIPLWQTADLVMKGGYSETDALYQQAEALSALNTGDKASYDKIVDGLAFYRTYTEYAKVATEADRATITLDNIRRTDISKFGDVRGNPDFLRQLTKNRADIDAELRHPEAQKMAYSNELIVGGNKGLDDILSAVGMDTLGTRKPGIVGRGAGTGVIATAAYVGVGFTPIGTITWPAGIAAFMTGTLEGMLLDPKFDEWSEKYPEYSGLFLTAQLTTGLLTGGLVEPGLERGARVAGRWIGTSPALRNSRPVKVLANAQAQYNMINAMRGDLSDPKLVDWRTQILRDAHTGASSGGAVEIAMREQMFTVNANLVDGTKRGIPSLSLPADTQEELLKDMSAARVRITKELYGPGDNNFKIAVLAREQELTSVFTEMFAKARSRDYTRVFERGVSMGDNADIETALIRQFDPDGVLENHPAILDALFRTDWRTNSDMATAVKTAARQVASDQVQTVFDVAENQLLVGMMAAQGFNKAGSLSAKQVRTRAETMAETAMQIVAKRQDDGLFPNLVPENHPDVLKVISDWDTEAFGPVGLDSEYFMAFAKAQVELEYDEVTKGITSIGLGHSGSIILNPQTSGLGKFGVELKHPILRQAAYIYDVYKRPIATVPADLAAKPWLFNSGQMLDEGAINGSLSRLIHQTGLSEIIRKPKPVDTLRLGELLRVLPKGDLKALSEVPAFSYDRTIGITNELAKLPVSTRQKMAFNFPDYPVAPVESLQQVDSVAKTSAMALADPNSVPTEIKGALDRLRVPVNETPLSAQVAKPEMLKELEARYFSENDFTTTTQAGRDNLMELIGSELRGQVSPEQAGVYESVFKKLDILSDPDNQLKHVAKFSEPELEVIDSLQRRVPEPTAEDYLARLPQSGEPGFNDDIAQLRKDLFRTLTNADPEKLPQGELRAIQGKRAKDKQKVANWYRRTTQGERAPVDTSPTALARRRKANTLRFEGGKAEIYNAIDDMAVPQGREQLKSLADSYFDAAERNRSLTTSTEKVRWVRDKLNRLDLTGQGALESAPYMVEEIIGGSKESQKLILKQLLDPSPEVSNQARALVESRLREMPIEKGSTKKAELRRMWDELQGQLTVIKQGRETSVLSGQGIAEVAVPSRPDPFTKTALQPEEIADSVKKYRSGLDESDEYYASILSRYNPKNLAASPQEAIDIARGVEAYNKLLLTRLRGITRRPNATIEQLLQSKEVRGFLTVDDALTAEGTRLAGTTYEPQVSQLQLAFLDRLNGTKHLSDTLGYYDSAKTKRYMDAYAAAELDARRLTDINPDDYNDVQAYEEAAQEILRDKLADIDATPELETLLDEVRIDFSASDNSLYIPAELKKALGQRNINAIEAEISMRGTKLSDEIVSTLGVDETTESMTEYAIQSKMSQQYLKALGVNLDNVSMSIPKSGFAVDIATDNPQSINDFMYKATERAAAGPKQTKWSSAYVRHRLDLPSAITVSPAEATALANQRDKVSSQLTQILQRVKEAPGLPESVSDLSRQGVEFHTLRMMDIIAARKAALLMRGLDETMMNGKMSEEVLLALKDLEIDVSGVAVLSENLGRVTETLFPNSSRFVDPGPGVSRKARKEALDAFNADKAREQAFIANLLPAEHFGFGSLFNRNMRSYSDYVLRSAKVNRADALAKTREIEALRRMETEAASVQRRGVSGTEVPSAPGTAKTEYISPEARARTEARKSRFQKSADNVLSEEF